MRTVIAAAGVLDHPEADAVVVEDGTVSWVGPLHRLGLAADHTFPGGVVIPGLRDSHVHPVGYAAALDGLSVAAASDFGELTSILRAHASSLRPGAGMVGNRLDEEKFAEGRLPTRADLDRAVDDRPVVLVRVCSHVAVANTTALLRAGVSSTTLDPGGGSFDRDPSGRPNGILRERAVGLVTGALAADIPGPSESQIVGAVGALAAAGLTSIDAIVSVGTTTWCSGESELDDLLAVAGDLPIPVRLLTIADTPEELESAAGRIAAAPGPVTWSGWKGFADGSLGGHTAALDDPYSDATDTRGTALLDASRDAPVAERALDLGGEVAIHAIGDRGNRIALEFLSSLGRVDPGRLRVEHASLLPPKLVAAMGARGFTASVQPAFARSDAGWVDARLGSRRSRWAYPLESMRLAGIPMGGGSDAPVEDPNPWPSIAAAAAHPIQADQSLSRGDALALYLGHDLSVGSAGDLVVVDRDPLTATDLGGTATLATYVGGRRLDVRPVPWPG